MMDMKMRMVRISKDAILTGIIKASAAYYEKKRTLRIKRVGD